MRISSDGRVGIGTNNPLTKLDVAGQVKVSTLSYTGSNSNENPTYRNTTLWRNKRVEYYWFCT